jgi:benzoylformate decarboxylase
MTAELDADPAVADPRPTKLGRDLFFEYLEYEGVRYIFGNPGTTELPLVDGCNDHPSVSYVLSLHEDIAVAQAMGYARASGEIGVVNLHVAPGLAHGLGNLYNAFRARVPLLITAGQHHTGLMVQDPILTADLAGMVRPFTKWAYEVTLLEELPIALQRAFKELRTPPYGPVFLSFPMNLLLEKSDRFPDARVSSIAGVVADGGAPEDAAAVLAEASSPMIIAGDGVGHARAWDEVAALAEACGATVYTEGYSTLWNFPPRHPLYAGPMSNLASEMRHSFDGTDVVVLCGVTSQAPVSRYDDGGPLVPWRVRSIALDDSPWEIGKNQPVEVGLFGDIRRNLLNLIDAVHRRPPDPDAVARRTLAAQEATESRRSAHERGSAAARASGQITPALVAAELRELLPPDFVFVDESISNRPSFVNALDFGDPLAYFAANGLSLGYSGGAATGIQMALPHRRVVSVVGDGSLLYYPHALWNAASLRLPVLFIVLNNGCYRVLKLIVERMGGPWGSSGDMPPGLTIGEPAIDFVALAGSFGLDAERARTPAELRAALERGIGASVPYLVDVQIEQG